MPAHPLPLIWRQVQAWGRDWGSAHLGGGGAGEGEGMRAQAPRRGREGHPVASWNPALSLPAPSWMREEEGGLRVRKILRIVIAVALDKPLAFLAVLICES